MITVSKEALFAGRSRFTVANDSDTHLTFEVKKAPTGDAWFGYYVDSKSAGILADEPGYVGRIFEDGTLRLTGKSRFGQQELPFKVLAWAVKKILIGQNKDLGPFGNPIPPGYSIQNCGRCSRCNRELTNPVSIALGIGPECITKV